MCGFCKRQVAFESPSPRRKGIDTHSGLVLLAVPHPEPMEPPRLSPMEIDFLLNGACRQELDAQSPIVA